MPFDPNQFVVRRPRHSAAGSTPGHVWLEALSDLSCEPQDVHLHDFSRRGARVELSSPVPPKAELILHLEDESMGLSVELRGTVCWQRTEGVGRWMLGCQFEKPVPYEVIGELFLSGVLSTVSPSE